jgi:hypothetical protein
MVENPVSARTPPRDARRGSFVVAQILSWRRASGERRQQLKWLQDSVDLAAVQADLARVVHGALEPAHISLWTSSPG